MVKTVQLFKEENLLLKFLYGILASMFKAKTKPQGLSPIGNKYILFGE